MGARTRITLVVSLVFVVAIVVMSIGFYGLLQRQLLENIDQANERRVRDIATLVDGEAVAERDKDVLVPGARGETEVAQIVSRDGSVIASSPNVRRGTALPYSTSTPISGDVVVGNVSAPYRLAATTQTDKDGHGFTVVAGASLEPIEATLRTVTVALVFAVPILTALVATLTWVAVGRSLRPVEAIRGEFARISTTDLHRRVPHPGSADELGALADTLNETLARLEQDVGAQQRFVADAAHELRSPLAALSAQLELARADPRRCTPETMTTLLAQTLRLEQLVDDLLVLARHDGVAPRSRARQLVDLDEVVLEDVIRARLTTTVPIDANGVSSAQVRADRDDMQRVVRNLLDNAVRHASSQVSITLTERGTNAVLMIDDDGPGVAPDDRARIFERFTRLDAARDRSTGGTGLGLAIGAEIAAAHDGRIDVAASPEGGARFVLELPAALPA